ncbi:unnamed protein product [Taenia asiatica]|uniref:A20-type domain-containing protein n=1 Tax=Taenia asiatica TaxID=60517 RepID=A0A0R3W0Y1_TAEAS|nr:unnamed protein product [Taenia asiatica]
MLPKNNKTPEVESETAGKNLCKRGCGFYGSVQFNNMCSKCYQEFLKSEKSTQTSKNMSAAYPPLPPNQSVLLNDLDILKKASLSHSENFACKRKLPASESSESCKCYVFSPFVILAMCSVFFCFVVFSVAAPESEIVSKSGFQCRCEGLFCALHRYSDLHNCTFDYRKQGQDQIARDNPEVRCPKIRKI